MNMERQRRIANLPRLAALCVLALGFAQPVLAQGELAAAPQGGKVSASATVTFRIVVRETVRLDARHLVADVASHDRRSPAQHRRVDVFDDMQVVTLARP